MSNRKQHDFSHSMNDLFASIAAVFLILLAGLIIARNNDEAAKEDKIDKVKTEIFKDIVKELGLKELGPKQGMVAQKDCIKVDGNSLGRVKIYFFSEKNDSLCNGLTFATGSYQLGTSSIELINTKLLRIFRDLVCSDKIRQVSVIGHSDVAPQARIANFVGCGDSGVFFSEATHSFCNNYSLSAKRAESVYFILRNALVQSDQKSLTCVDQRFVTEGRGPTQPFNDQAKNGRKWVGEEGDYTSFSELDRAKDRRVEIEILLNETGGL